MSAFTIIKYKIGLTIAEVLIVSLIIGSIAAIGFSNYQTAALSITNKEAENVLFAMYMARREYDDYAKFDKTKYDEEQLQANVTLNDLWTKGGLQITSYLVNFNNIRTRGHDTGGFFEDTLFCPEWSAGSVRFFGALDARDGTYSLYIGEDGEFYCTPCDSKKCVKMGYTTADKKGFKLVNPDCSTSAGSAF